MLDVGTFRGASAIHSEASNADWYAIYDGWKRMLANISSYLTGTLGFVRVDENGNHPSFDYDGSNNHYCYEAYRAPNQSDNPYYLVIRNANALHPTNSNAFNIRVGLLDSIPLDGTTAVTLSPYADGAVTGVKTQVGSTFQRNFYIDYCFLANDEIAYGGIPGSISTVGDACFTFGYAKYVTEGDRTTGALFWENSANYGPQLYTEDGSRVLGRPGYSGSMEADDRAVIINCGVSAQISAPSAAIDYSHNEYEHIIGVLGNVVDYAEYAIEDKGNFLYFKGLMYEY